MVGGDSIRYFDILILSGLCNCYKMVNGFEW